MPDGEQPRTRSLEIRGTLQLEPSALDERLKKIEQKLGGSAGKVWAWISDVLKTLLPSVVIALVGFYLKDTVDQALRTRSLQLEAIKEMQTYATQLQEKKIDLDRAEAIAVQLAAYGRDSVPFFVNVVEIGNESAGIAAEDGLRMVARSEPVMVCAAMRNVILNRYGLYRWQTHKRALKVLGQAGCTEARDDVAAYQKAMASRDGFQKWIAEPAQEFEYQKVLQQAATTQEQLNRAYQAPPSGEKSEQETHP
jgi:hypothetical protein